MSMIYFAVRYNSSYNDRETRWIVGTHSEGKKNFKYVSKSESEFGRFGPDSFYNSSREAIGKLKALVPNLKLIRKTRNCYDFKQKA